MELDADATGQPPDAPPPAPNPRRLAALGIAASIVLHALLLIAMAWGGVHRTRPPITIDIETVPIAPAAEELAPEEALPPLPPPATPPAASEEAVLPPAPPADEGLAAIDAGVDAEPVAAIDAGVDAAKVAAIDAGVDAEPVDAIDAGDDAAVDLAATGDAGVDDGDGGLLAAAAGDGGRDDAGVATDDGGAAIATATSGDGGVAQDGGVALGAGGDASVAPDPDPTGNVLARPSSGTRADLIKYFPPGQVVSVLIRLDRLRDTDWAERIERVIRPLPDGAALSGGSDLKFTDRFESLSFSSSQPRDMLATTVVAHTRMAPSALRDFLDSPDAPAAWSVVTGGVLGRRGRSRVIAAGDPRVFLLWQRGWVTLARPDDLAGLTTAAPGELDRAAAAPAALPPWLAQVGSIESESGHPTGPAIMVTAAKMFPKQIPLPLGVGSLPGPDSGTVTLELDPHGFIVKGNLRYADEPTAATAADAIARVRTELLDDRMISLALRQFRAYNAIDGLSVKRTGRRVAFATSISTADGQALMELATNLVVNAFPSTAPPAPAP